MLRVEKAAAARRAASARATVQKNGWNAVRVARHVIVKLVAVADVEHALLVRRNLGEESHLCTS